MIFKRSLKDFVDIQAGFKTDRYKGFGESGLNNAYLMSIGLYNRHFILFEKVMIGHENSVKNMLDHLQEISDKRKDMLADFFNLLEVVSSDQAIFIPHNIEDRMIK